jgi:hypothetical protein
MCSTPWNDFCPYFRMKRTLLPVAALLAALILGAQSAPAAINPDNFKRVASDIVRLREIARIVHTDKQGDDKLRRVTIVGQIVAAHESRDSRVGDTIVIDYTVNLTKLERAAKEHTDRQGNMPGRQFMSEPEPPKLDEKGEFWAHLARAGGRLGNVNRHAGAVVGIGDYEFKGDVFVPVAGQYSFDAP